MMGFHLPSFLCLSQESSAPKSLGAKESFTAQTRRGWIPVTSTGMREVFSTVAVLITLLFTSLPAFAFNPDEVLSDPALEARARALTVQLRCMVCQNQSIDDSNAELARDLRVLVRERLTQGDSDEAVVDYVVSRYGEFVLLKPRFSARTIALWGAPIALILIGATAIFVFARRRVAVSEGQKLTVDEEARIRDLLG
ncbi:Cytochrome c-type biogenesis protein CcmH precursor [Agrobacterium sp. DSM 25558]|nr:Cytochrome c-type biogenesis protein CcmH precursor [Agrobacterium sp. DSM 25558]